LLTGTISDPSQLAEDDARRTNYPKFSSDNFKHNVALVGVLTTIARERSLTAAQLALAWLLQQGVVPIPGSRHIPQLEENYASADVVLTGEDLARINEVAPAGAFAGQRYADMSGVNL
jgi:aryl-alcohol dehydrogenase-like predicted oxidoreductase